MIKKEINGLLISAGLSGRMGAFKPLMQFNGETFVNCVTQKLLRICDHVIVVTGFQREKVESVCRLQSTEKIVCVFNPNYEIGMFTSLKAGIEHLRNSNWVLYHFVDQPFFADEFYDEMILQISDNYDWVQPVHNGNEGHPVIFNKKIIDIIAESSLDSNLRIIRDLPSIRKNYWICDYPEVLKDFDTPEDLENYRSKKTN